MKKLLPLFIVLLANAAIAQIPYSPDDALRGELKAQGIDAAQVDWIAMDNLCAGYRPQPTEHRHCVQQKVADHTQFKRDSAECQRIAAAPHPTLPDYQLPLFPSKFKNQQEEHAFYRHQHQAQQLAERRLEDPTFGDYSYETCMTKKGWRDPARWQAGRKPD